MSNTDEQYKDFSVAEYEEFLKKYYFEDIESLAHTENEALFVDFDDLLEEFSDTAYLFLDEPENHLGALNNALRNVTKIIDLDFYKKFENVTVNIINLPENYQHELRDLGHKQRNKLISMTGRVDEYDLDNKPVLKTACFVCNVCHTRYLIEQDMEKVRKPHICEEAACRQRSFSFVAKDSEYRDQRIIRITDGEGYTLKVILLDALVFENIKLGDLVLINGFLKLRAQREEKGVPKQFTLNLIANHYENLRLRPSVRINEEKVRAFVEEDYSNFEKLIHAIHPASSNNHWLPYKTFAIMTICSGGAWDTTLKRRLTINTLCCGEVGWFKTTCMARLREIKGSENIGKTTGHTTTRGGLVPTVVKGSDGLIKVQGGLLPIYDKKTVWIDEAHILDDLSKSALAELESGVVPVTKWGQYMEFPIKTSVVITQNWVHDTIKRDDKTFSENVGLPPNVLDRFDLIFELKEPTSDVAEEAISKRKDIADWIDEELFTYFDLVKEIYCGGTIELPQEIEDEIQEYWTTIYDYVKSEKIQPDEKLNIRSLNTIEKTLKMLAAIHLRHHVTQDDLNYLRGKIIPHIVQFMKIQAMDKIKLDTTNAGIKVVQELLTERELVTLSEFHSNYREFLLEATRSHIVTNKLMPEENTLDLNRRLRTLIERMKKRGAEYDIQIDSTPKIGTVFYYAKTPPSLKDMSDKNRTEKKSLIDGSVSDTSDMSDIGYSVNSVNYDSKGHIEDFADPTLKDKISEIFEIIKLLDKKYERGIPEHIIFEETSKMSFDQLFVSRAIQSLQLVKKIYQPIVGKYKLLEV